MSLQLLWREIEVYWCGGLFFLVKKSIHMNIFCWQLEKSVYTRHLNPSKMIMKLTALLKNSSVAAIALALTFSFGAVACGDKNEPKKQLKRLETRLMMLRPLLTELKMLLTTLLPNKRQAIRL